VSFPVCVYKFSSHYLNNIIFIDNSSWPLARESPCILGGSVHTINKEVEVLIVASKDTRLEGNAEKTR